MQAGIRVASVMSRCWRSWTRDLMWKCHSHAEELSACTVQACLGRVPCLVAGRAAGCLCRHGLHSEAYDRPALPSLVDGNKKRPEGLDLHAGLAEAVRFELTNGFPLLVFKTSAIDHSATPP